ncbi:MAG: hypothetical protein ABIK79_04850 [Chloroflexota bacterium]
MRLLVDTNIFLEVLLEQDRAEEAQQLLHKLRRGILLGFTAGGSPWPGWARGVAITVRY